MLVQKSFRIAKASRYGTYLPFQVFKTPAFLNFSSSQATTDESESVFQTSYDNILVEQTEPGVALITLNRPQALNAVSSAMSTDLYGALSKLDKDPQVLAIVLTGNERAFAAGGDIKENQSWNWPGNFMTEPLDWDAKIQALKTPLIGAVNGYAIGGGSELAMMCDILLAGDEAKFAMTEVNIGTIPGLGGSQRLARAIGKSRAMEMCLTGDFMGAQEAAQRGLVNRVVPAHMVVEEACKIGRKIAMKSAPSIALAKECVNQAEEMGLAQGLRYERRLFQSTFATEDQKEGMSAFVEKRRPYWKHQ